MNWPLWITLMLLAISAIAYILRETYEQQLVNEITMWMTLIDKRRARVRELRLQLAQLRDGDQNPRLIKECLYCTAYSKLRINKFRKKIGGNIDKIFLLRSQITNRTKWEAAGYWKGGK